MDELGSCVADFDDADELFAATIQLMWHLHERAQDPSLQWVAEDLLAAFGCLGTGPWPHANLTAPLSIGLPFGVLATLLDRMLDRLEQLSPGFGARVAIANATACLDPDHSPVHAGRVIHSTGPLAPTSTTHTPLTPR